MGFIFLVIRYILWIIELGSGCYYYYLLGAGDYWVLGDYAADDPAAYLVEIAVFLPAVDWDADGFPDY